MAARMDDGLRARFHSDVKITIELLRDLRRCRWDDNNLKHCDLQVEFAEFVLQLLDVYEWRKYAKKHWDGNRQRVLLSTIEDVRQLCAGLRNKRHGLALAAVGKIIPSLRNRCDNGTLRDVSLYSLPAPHVRYVEAVKSGSVIGIKWLMDHVRAGNPTFYKLLVTRQFKFTRVSRSGMRPMLQGNLVALSCIYGHSRVLSEIQHRFSLDASHANTFLDIEGTPWPVPMLCRKRSRDMHVLCKNYGMKFWHLRPHISELAVTASFDVISVLLSLDWPQVERIVVESLSERAPGVLDTFIRALRLHSRGLLSARGWAQILVTHTEGDLEALDALTELSQKERACIRSARTMFHCLIEAVHKARSRMPGEAVLRIYRGPVGDAAKVDEIMRTVDLHARGADWHGRAVLQLAAIAASDADAIDAIRAFSKNAEMEKAIIVAEAFLQRAR